MSGNSRTGLSGIPQPTIRHRHSGHGGSPRDEEQTKIRRELTEYGINISNVQLQNDRLQSIFQSLTTVDLPTLTQRIDALESEVKLLFDMLTSNLEAIVSQVTSKILWQQTSCRPSPIEKPLALRDRRSASFESIISTRSYETAAFSEPRGNRRCTLDVDEVSLKTMDSDDDDSPCISIVDDEWDSGDTRSVVTASSNVSHIDYADEYQQCLQSRRNLTKNKPIPENGDASKCFLAKKMDDFCERSFHEGRENGRLRQRSASGDDATIVPSSDSVKKPSCESSPCKDKVPSGSSETFRQLLDALQALRKGTKN